MNNMNYMNVLRQIFTVKFNISRDTIYAIISGIAVIGLSYSLRLFQGGSIYTEAAIFLILDIVIKVIIGFYFPIWYMIIQNKLSLKVFGITKEKWKISLTTSIILMFLLLAQFISESDQHAQNILIRPSVLISIFYILVAGVFEMTYLYGFLRHVFDETFGIIPGILLTAFFYSLHHAGFQPEFTKLFFVGVLYASVYRLTNNILIVFPFFWGIGAVWDVLINFGTGELEGFLTIAKAASVLFLMVFYLGLNKNSITRGEDR